MKIYILMAFYNTDSQNYNEIKGVYNSIYKANSVKESLEEQYEYDCDNNDFDYAILSIQEHIIE